MSGLSEWSLWVVSLSGFSLVFPLNDLTDWRISDWRVSQWSHGCRDREHENETTDSETEVDEGKKNPIAVEYILDIDKPGNLRAEKQEIERHKSVKVWQY